SPLLLDNTVPDGQYRPLWALSRDRNTHTLLVGRVCITYSKKGFAIISHWLPTAGPNSISFRPCPGCSHHVPKYATLSVIKWRCTSERCFLQIQLADTVAYPIKNAKVFATGRLRLLAETRGFQQNGVRETAKTSFAKSSRNAETVKPIKIAKLP
ncbi:hypothetical protein RhiirA5_440164, partial [Rhizophagus irregularis]